MFGAARQCEEFINENHRRKHVVRFCSRYSGFDLQLRQCRSLPGEGPVQRLPARAALHAWPRPEMARPASAPVNVRFLKPYRRPGGTSYHQSVISSENDLMRLPEFTRSTTLPLSSPAWPCVLWLWPEFADMSRVSAKARDDLWRRAMKNSPRGNGLRDNNLRKAAQRIVKEIRARRNPISFDGTEFESSLGYV